MNQLLPVSILLPTRNRPDPLKRMLHSLAQQSFQPIEMVVVDGSSTEETEQICRGSMAGLATQIIYHKAIELGAATQRNQAFAYASQPYILFLDDDIWFEPDCLMRLWQAMQSDAKLGGVNAMITNQKYLPPGCISRLLFQLLHGRKEESYAGKCIGPALNLLPEDRNDLPEVVPVEWLNLGCTLYRYEALPNPPFPKHFTGYSFLEDATLSILVGKQWKLANVRTAKIFHDSQPGDHKNNAGILSKMELVNRHYVMTHILGRSRLKDYLNLAVLQLFGIAALLTSVQGWRSLPAVIAGKLEGIACILSFGKETTRTE
ncbi:MAG: glycosyltransferase [Oculatellaceae cyanobacterium bins.114]|nr:glycosyltransferase [Oculatellaceae cyanobacterium bins.114]